MGEDAGAMFDAAGFRVIGAEDQFPEPEGGDGPSTHRAGSNVTVSVQSVRNLLSAGRRGLRKTSISAYCGGVPMASVDCRGRR